MSTTTILTTPEVVVLTIESRRAFGYADETRARVTCPAEGGSAECWWLGHRGDAGPVRWVGAAPPVEVQLAVEEAARCHEAARWKAA